MPQLDPYPPLVSGCSEAAKLQTLPNTSIVTAHSVGDSPGPRGLGMTSFDRRVIGLTTLCEVAACLYRRGQSRPRSHGRPGVWLLVVLAFWTGNGAALSGDQPDPSGPPQSTALPEEFGADRAQLVRALHDPCLKGRIVTCYTPGYRNRAVSLQQLLTGELSFVQQRLRISVPLLLAVLDEHQWPLAEHELPYAMPSVHGEPPIALVAANWAAAKDFYPKAEEAGNPAVLREIARHRVTWDQANAQAGDLLSAHELGHAVIDAYGIVPGSHWLDEFLASYIWYAYISERRPQQLWLFDVIQAGNQLARPQRFVTLTELDKNYRAIVESDAQTNNYGWYQGQLIERVRQIYPMRGFDFVREIRAAFPPGASPQLGSDEALRRVARIDPTFGDWAKGLATSPRRQDIAP
jgi:hypothetical protein